MKLPLLALSLLLLGACSAPRLELMPRAMQFNVSGDFRADTAGGLNADNSLESLGIDDDPVEFAPRVDLEVGALEITADWFAVSYAGTGTVEQEIEFGGQTFPVNADVNTEMELSLGRVAATLDFIPTKAVDVALGVGAAYADARVFMEEQLAFNSATTEEQAPFPFLAGRGRLALGSLSAEVLVGWLEFEYDSVDASYLDVDALLRWGFLGGDDRMSGALLAGYRYISVDLAYQDGGDDIALVAELSGPYLGLSLAF
jgi:hypothetical protein